ncbi:ABC transporter ATP-binding protein, partial [Streptococcus hyovaginalis]
TRDKYELEIDQVMEPTTIKVSDTNNAAKWLLHEDAPHMEPPESVKQRMLGFSQTGKKDGGKR